MGLKDDIKIVDLVLYVVHTDGDQLGDSHWTCYNLSKKQFLELK